ncbi:Protein lin-9 [Chamberlinius hualienensis]
MAESIESDAASAEVLLSIKNGPRSRVRTPAKSPPKRDVPPRIRKRNRLFFNDDEETSFAVTRSSPRKSARVSTPKKDKTVSRASSNAGAVTIADKKASQNVYYRLRNLLKLPKAHKWVCYEFFYSNLDLPLFEGDNEFCTCLKELFPKLRTRMLSRVQWCKIRRLMGKPRRCSTAFFTEERAALHTKRSKIRLLQQRKVANVSPYKELPTEIPLPLVIGTKVTARLRRPQDGLFTGSIDAVDTSDSSYRVTFDKQGLGTHSIPDFEILSNDCPVTMPLSSFAQPNRPRSMLFNQPPSFPADNITTQLQDTDPLLGCHSVKSKLLMLEESSLGGFPIKFLVLVVGLSKILNKKKEKIRLLRDMNTQVEKMKSYQEMITGEFQKRYAKIVLEMETLNKDLNEYLLDVQKYCQDIYPDQSSEPEAPVLTLKEKCQQEATVLVEKSNKTMGRKALNSKRLVDLVSHLTSVMLHIKMLTDVEFNSFELKSLNDSLNEIRTTIDPGNVSVFQNYVEIHVNHMQSSLSQMGNLHAFSAQSSSN